MEKIVRSSDESSESSTEKKTKSKKKKEKTIHSSRPKKDGKQEKIEELRDKYLANMTESDIKNLVLRLSEEDKKIEIKVCFIFSFMLTF